MIEMSRRPLTADERQRLETLLAEVKEQGPLKILACSSGCLLLILGLAGSSLLMHLLNARHRIHSFADFFTTGGWALCAVPVAAVLLTLDRTDFHGALGREIYGMRIRTPAVFLIEQRKAGLI